MHACAHARIEITQAPRHTLTRRRTSCCSTLTLTLALTHPHQAAYELLLEGMETGGEGMGGAVFSGGDLGYSGEKYIISVSTHSLTHLLTCSLGYSPTYLLTSSLGYSGMDMAALAASAAAAAGFPGAAGFPSAEAGGGGPSGSAAGGVGLAAAAAAVDGSDDDDDAFLVVEEAGGGGAAAPEPPEAALPQGRGAAAAAEEEEVGGAAEESGVLTEEQLGLLLQADLHPSPCPCPSPNSSPNPTLTPSPYPLTLSGRDGAARYGRDRCGPRGHRPLPGRSGRDGRHTQPQRARLSGAA